MTTDTKSNDQKPPVADIEVEVVNPRYEGATPEMLGRALLQRPQKDEADEREG